MKYLLAPLLGAGYCLAFAPFGWWPVLFVAVAGLLLLVLRYPQQAPALAWWFGVGKYGLGASWVYVSIHVYGQASAPLAAALVALFVAFMAGLFCLPVGWLWRRLRLGQAPLRDGALFVACWSLSDWCLTWLLTGFPWLMPAHALLASPLGAWLSVFGTLGTGVLALLSAAGAAVLVWRIWHRAATRALYLPAGLAALPWLTALGVDPVQWTQPVSTHQVALVQGNLDQAVKWHRDQGWSNFRKHAALSESYWDADLLIWPEAAVTLFGVEGEMALERLAERGRATQTSVVVGVPGVSRRGTEAIFQNTVVGLGTARGRFAKHHLVPFGEYVPLEDVLRGLIGFFDLPMSFTSPGPARQALIQTQAGPLAMAICYEVAYGESMRGYASEAALLATVSNDTWFGASIGPAQHMQIAQVRAKENERWLLRATNSGITAVVDHNGALRARLAQFEANVLRANVEVRSGRTPYNRWGDVPFLSLLVAAFAVWLWYRRGILARSKNSA